MPKIVDSEELQRVTILNETLDQLIVEYIQDQPLTKPVSLNTTSILDLVKWNNDRLVKLKHP